MRSLEAGDRGGGAVHDYDTFDGQRLAYWHWPVERPHASLVYVHGIESHGGWFDATARRLVAQGVEVFAPDRRGSGHNWLGRGHCRAYEHLLLDLWLFVCTVAPERPVHLLGLSWGAKLAFAFAHDYPECVASLILVTPGMWPRVGLAPRDQWRVFWRWVRNTHTRLPVPLAPELFSAEPQVRHYIDADPQRLVAATPAFLWESRRLDTRVRRYRSCPVPVTCILSRPDRIIDTPRTQAWFGELTAPLSHTTIHEAGHALQLECPALLAADVLRWIAELPAE